MSSSQDRLRPHPADRFAGPEHRIDLAGALAKLRAEPGDGKRKHRQITVFHKGPLRLVLFAFEAGGKLAAHRAPGAIIIQALGGTLLVRTPHEQHELTAGRILTLDPDVVHDVEARDEADMLLTIALADA